MTSNATITDQRLNVTLSGRGAIANFIPSFPDTIRLAPSPPRLVPLVDRLVPLVHKALLPLRILRLVTSIYLQVENPTHATAHALEKVF